MFHHLLYTIVVSEISVELAPRPSIKKKIPIHWLFDEMIYILQSRMRKVLGIFISKHSMLKDWNGSKSVLYRPVEPNVHILLSKKVHIRLYRSVEILVLDQAFTELNIWTWIVIENSSMYYPYFFIVHDFPVVIKTYYQSAVKASKCVRRRVWFLRTFSRDW